MLVYKKINISVSGINLRSLIFFPIKPMNLYLETKVSITMDKTQAKTACLPWVPLEGKEDKGHRWYSSFSLQGGCREKRNICGDWEWSRGRCYNVSAYAGDPEKNEFFLIYQEGSLKRNRTNTLRQFQAGQPSGAPFMRGVVLTHTEWLSI